MIKTKKELDASIVRSIKEALSQFPAAMRLRLSLDLDGTLLRTESIAVTDKFDLKTAAADGGEHLIDPTFEAVVVSDTNRNEIVTVQRID